MSIENGNLILKYENINKIIRENTYPYITYITKSNINLKAIKSGFFYKQNYLNKLAYYKQDYEEYEKIFNKISLQYRIRMDINE